MQTVIEFALLFQFKIQENSLISAGSISTTKPLIPGVSIFWRQDKSYISAKVVVCWLAY
jgi:hypothetical protein